MTSPAPAPDQWQRTALRVAVCLALSVLAHLGSEALLASLPPRPPPAPRPDRVAMTVYERRPEPLPIATAPPVLPTPVQPPEPAPVPEPAPAPEPAPEPEPPPTPAIAREPRPAPPDKPRRATATTESPPPNRAPSPNAPAIPIQGLTLESTSTTGEGPATPTGNTHAPSGPADPSKAPAPTLPPGSAPVPTYTVKQMPTMVGVCRGKYTDAARADGIEGTVLLDLVVTAEGRTRDITVVKGLGHGLDEAAVATLAACRFKPGSDGQRPVAVQLRAFKVRFQLDEDGR